MQIERNETALVTGASSGMGTEIAKRLIKEGYLVYVAARRLKDLEPLRHQLILSSV